MEIKVELGNWQYNAGIVGLYEILKFSNENSVKIEENSIIFDSKELERFEENYFSYLIEKYRKSLPWYKIISYKEKIEKLLNDIEVEPFEEVVTEDKIKDIDSYIKLVLKYYLKSKSIASAYEFIKGEINPLELEKELKGINLKKNESALEKKKEIIETLNKIKKIIEYFELEDSKKYIGGKNVVYSIIKNGWNKVSFLNPQTKEKDIYRDLNNYFIEPVKQYLEEDKSKYKYNCFICDREIKKFDNDFSFLNNTGFDVARKPSHVWNFQNDVAMCPICKLVYSCIPAGFSYVHGAGLFINANVNIENLIRVNTKIKSDIYKDEKDSGIYKILSTGLRDNVKIKLNQNLQENIIKNKKYELEDIQLVRYENENYYFNILSKNMIRVVNDCEKEFDYLLNNSFLENGNRYILIDEVMKRILNNENLFSLIHRALYSKNSIKDKNYISTSSIISMLKINFEMLRGTGYMEGKEKDIIIRGRVAGRELRKKYVGKDAEHKISGIAYRILNGIKTNNKGMTMDTIINSYMYCKEQVPSIITEILRDNELHRTIGYAFVAGLLGKDYNSNENKDSEKINGEEN